MKTIARTILLIIVAALFFSCGENRSTKQTEGAAETPMVINVTEDTYYNVAYYEILGMLEGTEPVSIKRAAFLTEWAYLRGELDYNHFCIEITKTGNDLKRFIEMAGVKQYRTAGNFALFEYFTKPNWMNGNKPFSYDFEDFTGTDDYRKQFVTKVMRTHTGQCRSLPMYYKILAEEIGAEAYLAQAPNHLYVKHLGEDNKWVNIELTNGNLASDAHIISSMGISAESIRNRVYLDAMSETETLAFLLEELTNGYERLYGYDEFIITCCDKSLEYYPHNMPALMSKHNAARAIGMAYNEKNGYRIDSTAEANHNRWRKTNERIEELGYRDMPKELYLEWVMSMEAEKERAKAEAYGDIKQ